MTGENTCLNMQLPSTEQRYEMEPVLASLNLLIRAKQNSAAAPLAWSLLGQ